MKKEEKVKVEKFIKRQRKDGNVAAAEVTSKKNKKKKENEVNNDNNNVTTKEKVLHAKKPPNKNYTADDAILYYTIFGNITNYIKYVTSAPSQFIAVLESCCAGPLDPWFSHHLSFPSGPTSTEILKNQWAGGISCL